MSLSGSRVVLSFAVSFEFVESSSRYIQESSTHEVEPAKSGYSSDSEVHLVPRHESGMHQAAVSRSAWESDEEFEVSKGPSPQHAKAGGFEQIKGEREYLSLVALKSSHPS